MISRKGFLKQVGLVALLSSTVGKAVYGMVKPRTEAEIVAEVKRVVTQVVQAYAFEPNTKEVRDRMMKTTIELLRPTLRKPFSVRMDTPDNKVQMSVIYDFDRKNMSFKEITATI